MFWQNTAGLGLIVEHNYNKGKGLILLKPTDERFLDWLGRYQAADKTKRYFLFEFDVSKLLNSSIFWNYDFATNRSFCPNYAKMKSLVGEVICGISITDRGGMIDINFLVFAGRRIQLSEYRKKFPVGRLSIDRSLHKCINRIDEVDAWLLTGLDSKNHSAMGKPVSEISFVGLVVKYDEVTKEGVALFSLQERGFDRVIDSYMNNRDEDSQLLCFSRHDIAPSLLQNNLKLASSGYLVGRVITGSIVNRLRLIIRHIFDDGDPIRLSPYRQRYPLGKFTESASE